MDVENIPAAHPIHIPFSKFQIIKKSVRVLD